MNASEKQIQDSILQWLSLMKIFHYRQNTGALKTEKGSFVRFGVPGATDIVCIALGIYIGIEVKDHKGKQSELQKEFQRAVEAAGGVYLLVRSLEEVQGFFKGFYNKSLKISKGV